MSHIHPTSVVEPGARIAEGATIGPFCYIGPHVEIGAGTRLVSHITVLGHTRIGQGNTIWPQVVIGADPQDLKFRGEETRVEIGDNNDIREGVTIHLGTAGDRSLTAVGNRNLLMASMHVGHDCQIGNHTVIANGTLLAGHVFVEDYANIGGAVCVHHYVTIGRYAYIGGMTRITADVPPFMFCEGNPSRIRAVNVVGLRRRGFTPEQIARTKDAWRQLFRSTAEGHGVGRTKEAMEELEAKYGDDPCITEITAFLRRTTEGVYGRWREGERKDKRYANPVR